ncbi:Zn-dependent alcohol dehydrogenase [Thermomicrobium sp. CFH 73360]|uniref:Zn-dependent alcohol dehydrogenase n=1 Tax=Thermomicrobium sp. CFH 73360 TaxID=2951987 RepID=UPI00207792F7|nr:Zn-dependent alcohol dehydrogenase [Thermomicrobium sp. CFH 73360]MCM8746665.1 Zn-dependent alcohol dehydrogenase [Thermomicrobium sp. CFH 73360]
MRARAAVLTEVKKPLEIWEVDIDPPREGEVLVRVVAAGVCHSDLHYIQGDLEAVLPAVPGHEGAGVVEAVGSGVTRFQPGDPVLFVFRAFCGQCFYCLNGRPALCDFSNPIRRTGRMFDGTTRFHRDGQDVHHILGVSCFAEYTVVPEQGLLKLPADVPLDRAALVGCGVTTGVGAVLFAAGVRPGESVLVIGCGGVGLNVVQGAALVGAGPIIAADIVPQKLEWARQLGATHTVNPKEQDLLEAVRSLTEGRGADYAFEVIGRAETIQQAYAATRKGGTMVVVGLTPMGTAIPLDPLDLLRSEKTIKGTVYGSANLPRDIPRLIELYRLGQLKLDELISRRLRLEEINQGFEAMLAGSVARSIIVL